MSDGRRTIRGVEVMFPCKPYPSQFSFMDKVIQGIEKRQNCLLESPTGSGKSLALLCSALAWQTAEYNKKRQEEENAENSRGSGCCCKQKPKSKLQDSKVDNIHEDIASSKVTPASHISVNVIKGQIAHQQVNVIVNTTSTNLQLNYGAVSQSLLCVGGPQLQKECNQKYPHGVQPGQIAVTSGGNLKCDVIYHGALPQWKEADSLAVIKTFMKNCLTSANSNGYVSIAFPALGTGSLGYPRDVVAREMFRCVDDFGKENSTSSLRDVRFVVYGGDQSTVKIFEESQARRLGGNLNVPNGIMDNSNTVTPAAKNMSTIVIPESDDEDDDFKPSSKFRTPGSATESVTKVRKHQSISYDTSMDGQSPSEMGDEEDVCCNCGSDKKPESRKVPKIYFGTRTHKQISQIIRELKKTAYRETRMTILASKEHTCIHPEVSRSKNKNEGCKELMDGPGCKFNDRVKKIFPHYSNLQEYGLSEAWDLEDLVSLCKPKKVCPYFSVRSFRKEVDIVFCPYNYLIDPIIRRMMEINLKNEIIILDEAHNIEDSAREGASEKFTDEQLDKAYTEIHEMVRHEIKPAEHLRLQQMVEGFIKLIQDNMDQLEQKDYDQAAKVWSGYDIVVRMKEYGIGPDQVDHLVKCFMTVCEDMMEKTVKNIRGQTVKLSSATLSTLERMFKIMDFLYRNDLKYLQDYRVAILRSTSYVSDHNTDDEWISARHRRGGKKTAKYIITLHFWCMNPGVAFSDLENTRCIVLTSGTLSPMNSFESELGTPFPIKLEANHVIEDKQVWVGAMSQGPTGKPLHAVYKTMETWDFQDELGKTILQVCQEVPHGVLCFLPSYRSLEKFTDRWKLSGIYAEISKKKKIIQEPKRSDNVDFDELMKSFYDTIHGVYDEEDNEETTGALFLAVCRGKVSEGLDFADNFARAVITVGIPYPNWKDIQVGQKRMYNDQHRHSRGLLSGSEWYEIQAFRALNQALGRCIRHRKDWGLLILADERFVKNREKYSKGLSKWIRNKVQTFTSCKQAMGSISTFAKQRMKDMPVVNPDTSFIPGTPVTPGQNLGKSMYGASNLATPMTPATPVQSTSMFSPGTPLFPETFTQTPKGVHQTSRIPQPQFSTPEPNKAVPALTPKLDAHRLLSPSEVRKNAALTAAAKSGGVIHTQPGQQTQILLNNPQQMTSQGEGQITNNLSVSTYKYILSVMNSPLVPKDKPYYIIVDEGTIQQQMFLIQPNQGTNTTGQSMNASTIKQETSDVEQNVVLESDKLLETQRICKTTVSTINHQNQTKGLVSLLNNNLPLESVILSDETDASIRNASKSDSLSVQHISNKPSVNKQSIKLNKIFKYCKIPENQTNEKGVNTVFVSEDRSKGETNCPRTPTLFDTQDSEQEFKEDKKNTVNLSTLDSTYKQNTDTKIKSEQSTDKNIDTQLNRRPIFRRHSVAPPISITLDDDSPDDFKDQSKTGRKSCDKKILTEIQQNDKENKLDQSKNDEDEENESEEILKTRRKNRGAKRKSSSGLKSSLKKPKGVDFLDNIEDKKTESSERLIKCKCCGVILLSQSNADFEKRKRYPSFVKLLTTQRVAEVIFLQNLEVNSSNLTVVTTKLNDDSDITLNSFVDSPTGSVLQYLSCQSCTKDVVGIHVVTRGDNSKDVEDHQAWIVCSLVEMSKPKS